MGVAEAERGGYRSSAAAPIYASETIADCEVSFFFVFLRPVSELGFCADTLDFFRRHIKCDVSRSIEIRKTLLPAR